MEYIIFLKTLVQALGLFIVFYLALALVSLIIQYKLIGKNKRNFWSDYLIYLAYPLNDYMFRYGMRFMYKRIRNNAFRTLKKVNKCNKITNKQRKYMNVYVDSLIGLTRENYSYEEIAKVLYK